MSNGFQSREFAPEPRSGLNNTGVTIAKGSIVKWTTVNDEIVLAALATDAYAGVAGEDIPDEAWGRVVTRGTALVLFAAAQTLGARVASNTSGLAAAAVAGNAVLGIAREVGGTSVLAEVELSGPGGPEMPG